MHSSKKGYRMVSLIRFLTVPNLQDNWMRIKARQI